MQYDPEDKEEFIETFAPENKRALLRSKLIRSMGESYYQLYTIAGLFEVIYDKRMPVNKRYKMSLNNGHIGYYPSMIQASKELTRTTYEELFR